MSQANASAFQMVSRRLPPRLLVALRRLKLRALDAADALLRRRQDLVPPRTLVDGVGGFDFREVGEHLASIAIDAGRFRPSEWILDMGCGVGRFAVPLTRYITTGEYVGFDVSRKAVRWCERSISPRFPRFWFRHVDLANSHYNPKGSLRPESFRFPCADRSVDFAFAASLFTHLAPAAAEHYLAETARVLRPGGRAVLSFYLLDAVARSRLDKLWPHFRHFVEPSCAVADERDPEAAVAYDLSAISEALQRHGFVDLSVSRGEWVIGPEALSYQDFVFVTRGERLESDRSFVARGGLR